MAVLWQAPMNSISTCMLQTLLVEWQPDWVGLLHSDLGVTEVGVRTLLQHRHELQDATHLERTEKRAVEKLCQTFNMEEPPGL